MIGTESGPDYRGLIQRALLRLHSIQVTVSNSRLNTPSWVAVFKTFGLIILDSTTALPVVVAAPTAPPFEPQCFKNVLHVRIELSKGPPGGVPRQQCGQ